MSEEMKDVSDIGEAMKKQVDAMKLPELPQGMQQDISRMIAGALMGQFGQLQIAVGKDGDETGARKVRLLIYPDEIGSRMPEKIEAEPVAPVEAPVEQLPVQEVAPVEAPAT